MTHLALFKGRQKPLVAVAGAAAVAAALTVTAPVLQADSASAIQQLPSFRQLINDNVSAVVSVHGKRLARETGRRVMPQLPEGMPEQFRRFFDQLPEGFGRSPAASQGSGFIISADGYILTNAHVVDGSEEIFVRLNDNRELQAELIGSDKRSDVALLKVSASDLPAVRLGDSQALHVGDWVLAIGSPFGFDYSVSQGIVSAKGRSLPDGTYVPFIQTDVAVNPGNSGGPLFDLEGRVVGINSQIYSRSGGYQGLSFAIPINLAMDVVEQLKTEGSVSRGWLGVGIQNVNQALADSLGLDRPVGAAVTQVMSDSPAALAGVEVGDVIVKFDGKEVNRSSQLPPLVGRTAVGSTVAMEVLRDGEPLTLDVKIARLADPENPVRLAKVDSDGVKLGVAVADLSAEQLEQFNVKHGVLINGVEPDSPAAQAGLRDGDVILSYDRQDVKSVDQLVQLIKDSDNKGSVLLLVKRDDSTLFVPVQLS